jgi:hypothetical protein
MDVEKLAIMSKLRLNFIARDLNELKAWQQKTDNVSCRKYDEL